jgi:hypothetical protein
MNPLWLVVNHDDACWAAQIARTLPAETAFQVVRTTCTLGLDVSDVTAEVANAANRSARSSKGQRRAPRDDPRAVRADRNPVTPELASTSFPQPPLAARAGLASGATATPGRLIHRDS